MWLTLLVLYLILKHFFFEKVHNFMEARENKVRDAFENAEKTNKLADEKLEDYEKKIAEIEGEGREIIKNAKIKADSQAKDIVEEANMKASTMIKQAEQEVQRLQIRAMSDMKSQIATMAILAAEKIIEKRLDVSGQDELITKIIEEAGRSEWRI
ncbi:MAG: F0F1 ATP synthase subunit B [Anaerovoracaceae bacterium]